METGVEKVDSNRYDTDIHLCRSCPERKFLLYILVRVRHTLTFF